MGAPYALSSDLVSAWPAKSLEVAQYIDGQLPLIAMTQNAQTGTTYTLAATDFTKLVTLSNASPVTVTVPLESSVAWVAGTQLRLMNLGAGLVTVVGAGGVTINGSPLTLAQYKDGTLIKTGTNTWTFTSSSTGKILQVASTLKQDVFTTSSTSYTDVTGLSVNITPSSASSLVLVTVSLVINAAAAGYAVRGAILRGSTIIGAGTPAGSRPAASFYYRAISSSLADGVGPQAMQFLDSPASASAQTYKVQIAIESGSTAAVNRSGRDDNDNATQPRLASSITVMEFAA